MESSGIDAVRDLEPSHRTWCGPCDDSAAVDQKILLLDPLGRDDQAVLNDRVHASSLSVQTSGLMGLELSLPRGAGAAG